MKLSEVLQGLNVLQIKGTTNLDIKGVCHDSRLFAPGNLFVAIRGHQFDGHMFVAEACRLACPGVVVEDDRVVPMKYEGVVIKVKDTRKCIDLIAANFYGRPSRDLFVAGVTGTNGKTTTVHMIEALLNAHDSPTAVIGTIDTHLGEKKQPSANTTPDALEIQRLFSHWKQEGAKAVSMEVSSHALALARVDSVDFDVGVFTNLTRDHLDFHQTMEEYVKAKARLFQVLLKKSVKKDKRAIVNRDDPSYDRFICEGIPTWTFGLKAGDFVGTQIKLSFSGTHFHLKCPRGETEFFIPMIGHHNVLNALGAICVGSHRGYSLSSMADALKKMHGVRGRLERVHTSAPVHVFVDYAHSHDALRNVLTFLKQIRDETSPKSRITTVFGCGGDRDKGKRPIMMQVVQSLSDFTLVTSDNPRTEDPQTIVNDILKGADPKFLTDETKIGVELERRVAIEKAIKKSNPGDVVLIAGKGHEDYQIIGTKKFPFDDALIAKEILNR